MVYDRFHPGALWLDTAGHPIQAHGFSVLWSPEEGVYYWYGENKERTCGGPFNTIWHWGVRCYASRDLYNWEDLGLIIPPAPEDLSSPLHPTYCMDRPHILYCPHTGKYVAWLKIMCGNTSQFLSVLQADRFLGPYGFVHKIYKPLDMDTGDFDLALDGETGKAYVLFDRPHFELICATLSDTFTEVTGEYSAHCQGRTIPMTREAPVCFQKDGTHYLLTSGTSGYFPNPTEACRFTDWHGSYEELGEICEGDRDRTSFFSQFSCVLQVPGTQLYIAMADRWKVTAVQQWLGKRYYKLVRSAMSGPQGKRMAPDESPKTAGDLPQKKLHHGCNTSIARYVWLPIQWQEGRPVIRWLDEWRWEDFVSPKEAPAKDQSTS